MEENKILFCSQIVYRDITLKFRFQNTFGWIPRLAYLFRLISQEVNEFISVEILHGIERVGRDSNVEWV